MRIDDPVPQAGALGGDGAAAGRRFYLAVWRWHFYAGLLVLPFLVWLALTGGLYLFKNEIDGTFHRALKTVDAKGVALAPSQLAAAGLAAFPGTLVRFTTPANPTASVELTVAHADGRRLTVHVDPYTARVLGALPEGGSVAWTIRRLHSLKILGPWARALIELTAGWAVLLVATGLYLWWPRRARHALRLRAAPARRVFWRDLHASTGIVVGAVLAFLAVTGMPWSVWWGAQLSSLVNGQNFGYPPGVRIQVPMSELPLSAAGPTAWSLGQARLPASVPPVPDPGHSGHAAQSPVAASDAAPRDGVPGVSLDAAVARLKARGLADGFAVTLPVGPRGVFTGAIYPADLSLQRVIHLDRYSGQVLLDSSFADYGPVGRGLEWGINVHLGQEWGVINQWGLAVACLAIVLMCTSAAVMWWKRRPAGRLGVPPLPPRRSTLGLVVGMLAVGGILFPLVGLSLLVMVVLDALWLQRLPAWS